MSQRKAPKVGVLTGLVSVFIAVTTLLTLVAVFAFEVAFPTAAAWSSALVGGVCLLWLFSWAVTRLRQGVRRAKREAAKKHVITRGLAHTLQKRADRAIQAHRGALAKKRRECLARDDYGRLKTEAWVKAQDYFIDTQILRGQRAAVVEAVKRRGGLVAQWRRQIDAAVHLVDCKRADVKGFDFRPGMEGFEYEAFCASILRKAGWEIVNTRDTGDQGVDLVAKKNGVIVAIQCKRYRQNVGNDAVQQIVAGKATISAKARAAVVSNAGYTRSAHELAAVNDVLLLHHSDLPNLEQLLRSGPTVKLAA